MSPTPETGESWSWVPLPLPPSNLSPAGGCKGISVAERLEHGRESSVNSGRSEGPGKGAPAALALPGWGQPSPAPQERVEYCWPSCGHTDFTASAPVPHQQTQTGSPARPLPTAGGAAWEQGALRGLRVSGCPGAEAAACCYLAGSTTRTLHSRLAILSRESTALSGGR